MRSSCQRHPRAPSCFPSKQAPIRSRSPSLVMLRDDLHLEAVSIGLPVVRAYEACDTSNSAAAQIAHERNVSRAARIAMAVSPLPVVAILFFGTHFERLPLLHIAYQSYFKWLVYMSPSAEIAAALKRAEAQRRPSGPLTRAATHHCKRGIKATYACVADVAGRFVADDMVGVLYLHFDLWFQPWRLVASLSMLRRLWFLPSGRIMLKAAGPTRLLPLECFNSSRPTQYRGRYPMWTWDRDLPQAREGLRRACAAAPALAGSGFCKRAPGVATPEERLCIGWADAYYLPTARLPGFSALARAFSSTNANSEIALPTIMHMLAQHGTTAPAPALQRLPCWGFCCSLTGCPEVLAQHPCGHRMLLNDARVRTAVELLWSV